MAPPGAVLGTLGSGAPVLGRKGNHIRVVCDLGDGCHLDDSIPTNLKATGFVWTTEDSRHMAQGHAQRWAQYLKSEDLTDEVLHAQYFIWAKIGHPPLYLKSVVVGGDPSEGLTLLENFWNYCFALPEFTALDASVTIHNLSKHSFDEWMAESSHLTTVVGGYEMLPLRGIGLPDYRRAYLHLRQPSDGLYIVCTKWCWRGCYGGCGTIWESSEEPM